MKVVAVKWYGALACRNITVRERRTSMRLEPSMWAALEEVACWQGRTIAAVCSELDERLDGARGAGVKVNLTAAVRVYILEQVRARVRAVEAAEAEVGIVEGAGNEWPAESTEAHVH